MKTKIFSVKSLANREIIDFPQLCKLENVSAGWIKNVTLFSGIAQNKNSRVFLQIRPDCVMIKTFFWQKTSFFYLTKMGVNVCAGRCAVLWCCLSVQRLWVDGKIINDCFFINLSLSLSVDTQKVQLLSHWQVESKVHWKKFLCVKEERRNVFIIREKKRVEIWI